MGSKTDHHDMGYSYALCTNGLSSSEFLRLKEERNSSLSDSRKARGEMI